MNWTIIDLGSASLSNYRRSKTIAGQVLRRTKDKGERSIIGGMISDCQYVIDHFEQNGEPTRRRDVSRLSYLQREVLADPKILALVPNPKPTRYMDVNDYNRLIQVMAILSKREKQCFEMHYVGLWTEHEIAKELNVSRSAVQEYLERSNRKIKDFIKKPAQIELFPME